MQQTNFSSGELRKGTVTHAPSISRSAFQPYRTDVPAAGRAVSRLDNFPREYPENMYVTLPAVVRSISLFALILSLFSLGISYLTGFSAIHPFAAILCAAAAVSFLIMGEALRRSQKRVADRLPRLPDLDIGAGGL